MNKELVIERRLLKIGSPIGPSAGRGSILPSFPLSSLSSAERPPLPITHALTLSLSLSSRAAGQDIADEEENGHSTERQTN